MWIRQQVGQRGAIQHIKELLQRITQQTGQAAMGHDGAKRLLFRIEAFGDMKVALGFAYDLAHVDLWCRPGQTNAAALAAHGFDETLYAQLMHDFDQVVSGYLKKIGQFADGGQLLRLAGQINQDP